MKKKLFYDWLSKLGRAWENRNPVAAFDLFTENVIYHKTPFEKPYRSKKGVLKL